jgi:hypothetical protein
MMVSGLTMLGLDEIFPRYAIYPNILEALQRQGSDPDVRASCSSGSCSTSPSATSTTMPANRR